MKKNQKHASDTRRKNIMADRDRLLRDLNATQQELGEAPMITQQFAEDLLNQNLGRWQEAIRDLLVERTGDDSIDGGGCDSGDPLDLTLTEIRQAFNLMPRWNKVEDGLPKDDTLMFVFSTKNNCAEIARFIDDESFFMDHSGWVSDALDTLDNVTHWMEVIPPTVD